MIVLGDAGQFPVLAVFLAAPGNLDRVVRDGAARRNHELERTSFARALFVLQEEFCQRCAHHIGFRNTQFLECGRREVDQAAFAVAGPEPAQSGVLETFEQFEAREHMGLLGIVGSCDLAAFARCPRLGFRPFREKSAHSNIRLQSRFPIQAGRCAFPSGKYLPNA